MSLIWKIGCISAAASVISGAFGAHALRNRYSDPYFLKTWETASHYQMIHSVGLILTSFAKRNQSLTAALFAGGILLFSGSLYTLVLTQNKKFGMITPIGGTMFIAAWIALALAI